MPRCFTGETDSEDSVIRCSICNNDAECCGCSQCVTCLGRMDKHNVAHCSRCRCPCCFSTCSYPRYKNLMDENPRRMCGSCGVRSAITTFSEFPREFLSPLMNSKMAQNIFFCSMVRNSPKVAPSAPGLRWGLYVLRCAADLPNRCIMPHGILTYRSHCVACDNPTVPTAPHLPRSVTVSRLSEDTKNRLREYYPEDFHVMTMADAKKIISRLHPSNEDAFCFNGIQNSWDVLLASSAIGVAYEYSHLPYVSMSLSWSPYTKLLALESSASGYSVLEGPGKRKFIALPGTHNIRTGIVNTNVEFVQRHITLPKNFYFPASSVPNILRKHSNVRQLKNGDLRWEFSVHQGFSEEEASIEVRIERLLQLILRDRYEIILCGHSQGGAVAVLLTLQLLEAYAKATVAKSSAKPISIIPIRCISFGAPLVGDARLQELISECGWGSSFHHIVLYGDTIASFLPHPAFGLCVKGIRYGKKVIQDIVPTPMAAALKFAKGMLLGVPNDQSRRKSAPQCSQRTENRNTVQRDHASSSRTPGISEFSSLLLDALVDDPQTPPLPVYQCFGQYHFLFWGENEEYFSSRDPKTIEEFLAFNPFKLGFAKHSMHAYQREIFLHVCSRPLWYGIKVEEKKKKGEKDKISVAV